MKGAMQKAGDSLKKKVREIGRYRGFAKPKTTPTPDDVFDLFLADLTHAELKVLLYIVRRTFGFKKTSDRISLKQICGGIVRKNGRRLDGGTGLSRQGAITAVKRLEERGLITVVRVKTEDGYNRVNIYKLRLLETRRG